MMMALLLVKSRIKNYYEKHYRVIRGVIKMCLLFAAFLMLTGEFPDSIFGGRTAVLILPAVLCGLTPDVVSVIFLVLLMCGEIGHVSPLLAVTVFLLLVIYFLIFGRLERGQSFIVFSIPLLATLHVSYAVPLVAALLAAPVMLPALFMGILLQFALEGVMEYSSVAVASASDKNVLFPIRYLADYLLQNRLLAVTVVSFCLTFLCVYFIRRRNFKHASQIAILVGTILLMTAELLSNIVMELNLNLLYLTLQVAVSMAAAYVIQFFRMTLDYHGTRRLQFEDDEYYYYVTAVPKYKVAEAEKKLTRIVPESEESNLDLKEELEKALEEEKEESESGV